jgi:hypothetical protein
MVRCYESPIQLQPDQLHSAEKVGFLCRACECHFRPGEDGAEQLHTGEAPYPATLILGRHAHQYLLQQFIQHMY